MRTALGSSRSRLLRLLVAEVVALRPFSAMTLGAFAAGSLLLAATGLYGLLAFTASERVREIAVRLALGAEPAAVLGRRQAPPLLRIPRRCPC